MMEQKKDSPRRGFRRWWQAAFALLLGAVLIFGTDPQARVNAIYLLADDAPYAEEDPPERVSDDRILTAGGADDAAVSALAPEEKVTILRGDSVRYAVSRGGESVGDLLWREGIGLEPQELVRAERREDGVRLEIASDFIYYETTKEPTSYTTVYNTDYTIPKGETRVTRAGQEGTVDVTYEVVYADGVFVSRQAVAEANNTSVPEVVSTGTLVTEWQSGDNIAEVVEYDDGSGYLILQSGDSMRFTHKKEVRCTAYTAGEPGVGTITYTGTQVHVGVVAVDKNVIPLGSWMFITTAAGDITYGLGHAEDTGVRGNTVDLYMDSLWECNQFGVRSSIAYFIDM